MKPVIQKFIQQNRYPLASNATSYEKYTIYKNGKSESLLVWFTGGAFLFCNRESNYGLLNKLNYNLTDCDILIFDYPVRFSATIHDTLQGANTVLKEFSGKYKNYIAAGYSAGVLLMGTFYRKEKSLDLAQRLKTEQIGIEFNCLISINGLYDTELSNTIMNNAFHFYIIRGTEDHHLYSMYNIAGEVPKLIIGTQHGFLYTQTEKFIHYNKCEKILIFTNDKLSHLFPMDITKPETKIIINEISTFIKKYIYNQKTQLN